VGMYTANFPNKSRGKGVGHPIAMFQKKYRQD